MVRPSASGEAEVSVSATLMREGTEPPHQIVLPSGLIDTVVEVIVTDIQVIGDTRLGAIGVHLEEELHQDTEAGEAGLEVSLYHVAPATEAVDVAAAIAPSKAVHQLKFPDLVSLQGMKGEGHLLGVGALRSHGLRWTPNHQSGQAKHVQDHHREAQTGGRAWSHMKMVLLIQAGESENGVVLLSTMS